MMKDGKGKLTHWKTKISQSPRMRRALLGELCGAAKATHSYSELSGTALRVGTAKVYTLPLLLRCSRRSIPKEKSLSSPLKPIRLLLLRLWKTQDPHPRVAKLVMFFYPPWWLRVYDWALLHTRSLDEIVAAVATFAYEGEMEKCPFTQVVKINLEFPTPALPMERKSPWGKFLCIKL